MSDIMNKYETIFVIDAALPDEQIEAISEKFQALISKNGEIESVDVWGKRKLAYPINYKTEGYYVLVNFSANADFPKELERIYGITEGIIRTIVVKKED